MAHSSLYGTKTSGNSERDTFGELEHLIDIFLDRFGDLSVVAIDLGTEAKATNNLRRGGYEGLSAFLARADVVGRLRSGTLAAIMIGYASETARWEAEKIWRLAPESGPNLPRVTLGIAQYEFGDTVEALVARAEKAMCYGRRRGADKAVEVNRSGHMVISDFHGQAAAPAAVAGTTQAAVEWNKTEEAAQVRAVIERAAKRLENPLE
ncbi:hypothetical protein [Zavarzinia aquatilis]|uniref:GGDEF domain-containing protein n=1 Tax=Zavarzinia aquatilis TaxID=2211142 RepID=A0A317EEX9_9PROT|nr:hypothetical protein [Zavarzinia aquatilis]PWR24844.1 hypothetical protein DKG74_03455 [Zavarzinia aquatilis]